jgi:peptidyl-prolyl cis-trans isomerase-like 2
MRKFRQDVITLQNPHGLPPASVSNLSLASKQATQDSQKTAPTTKVATSVVKAKESVPCEILSIKLYPL